MVALPRISDAEWQVMNVLWGRSPLSASEVVEALAGGRRWSPRTVKTLLNRLVGKGALSFRTEGKRYLYSPAVARTDCVRKETRSFAQRVFGGQAAPMLVHLVRSAKLSDDQIEDLKRLLDQKRGE